MKSKPIVVYLLFLLFISLVLSFESKGTIIEAPIVGGGAIGYLGERDQMGFATIGQTFRLNENTDRYLHSMHFYLTDANGSLPPLNFSFYLYEWTGSKITGDALFRSDMLTTTGYGHHDFFTISTGDVRLNIGQNYVWFLSASEYLLSQDSLSYIFMSLDYENGGIVRFKNGSNFDLLSQADWDMRYINTNDLAFKMDLIAVPEPGTLLLFIIAPLALSKRFSKGTQEE